MNPEVILALALTFGMSDGVAHADRPITVGTVSYEGADPDNPWVWRGDGWYRYSPEQMEAIRAARNPAPVMIYGGSFRSLAGCSSGG